MIRCWHYYVFLIALALFFSACSKIATEGYRDLEVSNLFTIEVPNYLQETTALNKDAECQFQNSRKDLCLLVRKNAWEELSRRQPDFILEDFYDVSIEQLKSNLDGIHAPAPDSISLNGLSAFRGTLSGNFKGDKITFNISTIAGNHYLYQLLIWTSQEESEQYASDIERVIQSFRELPGYAPNTSGDTLPSSIQTEEIQ